MLKEGNNNKAWLKKISLLELKPNKNGTLNKVCHIDKHDESQFIKNSLYVLHTGLATISKIAKYEVI